MADLWDERYADAVFDRGYRDARAGVKNEKLFQADANYRDGWNSGLSEENT